MLTDLLERLRNLRDAWHQQEQTAHQVVVALDETIAKLSAGDPAPIPPLVAAAVGKAAKLSATPSPKRMREIRRCSEPGCDGKHFCKGMCRKHYFRTYRRLQKKHIPTTA